MLYMSWSSMDYVSMGLIKICSSFQKLQWIALSVQLTRIAFFIKKWWKMSLLDNSKKCTWSFCLVIANKVSLVIWACYCWCSWTQIWVRRMARVGELRMHPTKTILLTHFHASEEMYHGLLRVRGVSFHHLCHWESMIWQDLVMFQSTGPKGGRQIGWIRVFPSSTRARPE